MSCILETRVGDIGTIFRGTIYDEDNNVQDISTATSKILIFRKPNGNIVPKAADFFTDGTDGKISYTSVSGDLDTIGRWQIEAQVTTPLGYWSSNIGDFFVRNTLSS